jgi:uncharacterized protein (DUF1800 family)
MKKSILWSLRLGFSGKEALEIEKNGIDLFIRNSIKASFEKKTPSFLEDDPKTLAELKEIRQQIKVATSEEQKQIVKKQFLSSLEMKAWWLDKMMVSEFPLREKMVCFWHNHFVSTVQKVKVNYWIYQHNQILRENAFGNFKELTKKILKTNAMVRYLDNVDNKKDKINENLSRELLELFTLGIGYYTENDIKNGAKSLAGLGLGETEAQYRRFFEDNNTITYLGKTGKFKVEDLVDIIFEQKAIPYLITKKILKWFIYDSPKEELVIYYGDYFRKVNFEIEPLLLKIFSEEYQKDTAGSKIKDPLVFTLQLINELKITEVNSEILALFLSQQGMDLFNQPNVKGWDGGNNWLTSQIFLQRHNASDLLCNGRMLNRKALRGNDTDGLNTIETIKVGITFTKGNNKQIISELTNRLLFESNVELQKDMEQVLKYDFDASNENAEKAVLRLFNYITKTPEYQLI